MALQDMIHAPGWVTAGYAKPDDEIGWMELGGVEGVTCGEEKPPQLALHEVPAKLNALEKLVRKASENRIVFEATGEFRPPKTGEWFREASGAIDQASYDFRFGPKQILRLVSDSLKPWMKAYDEAP